jgi:hypothetical protein
VIHVGYRRQQHQNASVVRTTADICLGWRPILHERL